MTRQEILTQIEKLDKGINNSLVADSLKSQMKDKKAELQKQLDELKKIEQAEKIAEAKPTKTVTEKKKKSVAKKTAVAKKQAVKSNVKKTIAEAKSILDSLPKKVKEFNKGRSQEEIENDAKVKALKSGRRVSKAGHANQYGVSKGGNVYYENRANRSDVSTKRKPYLEMGGQLSTTEKERLDYLQSKEDTDSLTKAENEEYEMLVEKYRLTSEYPHSKKADEMASLVGNVFRPFNSHNEEYWVTVLYADFENIEYADDRGEIHKAKTKDFLDSYIKVSGYYKKGGKLSNKGAYLNEPQSKTYTKYEDSKESNRAKPAGWRYTNAGAKRLKLKNPNQLVAKAHLERYRDRYFTDSKGNKHRYIYIERRADKSDIKRGFPYLERGGGVGNKPNLNFNAFFDKFKRVSNIGEPYKNMAGEKVSTVEADTIEVFNEIEQYLKEKNVPYIVNSINKKKLIMTVKNKPQFEKGGSIPNNYEGKTPEQVWNEWSVEQKKHFIKDHAKYIFGYIPQETELEKIATLYSNYIFKSLKKDNAGENLIDALGEHISEGQYEKGGQIRKGQQYDWLKDGVEHTIYVTDSKNGVVEYRLDGKLKLKSIDEFEAFLKENNLKASYYAKGGLFDESQYNTGRSWHQDRAKHNKSEDWEKPLSERKGYEDGGELSNMEIAETALKVYVKPSKKEGKALFKQGEAICVVYDDGNTDWVGEDDILKMEEGSIDAELPIDELQSQNIDVFGYETQNFDVSEHASSEFLKAISELSDESDFAKESLSKAAKHLDSILLKVKLKEEALSDVAERGIIKTILNDVQLFGYNNYASGLKISIDFISNICADIFELDIDNSNVYEYGGKMYGLGGLAVGNWYRDSSGEELRYIGKNDVTGELIFSDGTKRVTRTEQDFEGKKPKESKLFGWFEDGGKLPQNENYKIIEGYDSFKDRPLYKVVAKKEDNDYVGEWHTDIKDAEDEYKDLCKECGGEMYAKGGTIDKDTPIIPEMIAESVAKEKYFEINSIPKANDKNAIAKTDKEISELEKHLINKANTLYKNSSHFKEKIKGKGNSGRDYLYMIMAHWSDAYLNKKEDGGELYAKGGKPTFNDKVKAIANKLEGEKVKPKYQKEYGKKYDKEEAIEAATKIAGAMASKRKMKKGAKA